MTARQEIEEEETQSKAIKLIPKGRMVKWEHKQAGSCTRCQTGQQKEEEAE